jgi:hypothetical protein
MHMYSKLGTCVHVFFFRLLRFALHQHPTDVSQETSGRYSSVQASPLPIKQHIRQVLLFELGVSFKQELDASNPSCFCPRHE